MNIAVKTVSGLPKNAKSVPGGKKFARKDVEIPYCGLYIKDQTVPAITSETTYGIKKIVRKATLILVLLEILSAIMSAIGNSIITEKIIIFTLCPKDFQNMGSDIICLKFPSPTNSVLRPAFGPDKGPNPFHL